NPASSDSNSNTLCVPPGRDDKDAERDADEEAVFFWILAPPNVAADVVARVEIKGSWGSTTNFESVKGAILGSMRWIFGLVLDGDADSCVEFSLGSSACASMISTGISFSVELTAHWSIRVSNVRK